MPTPTRAGAFGFALVVIVFSLSACGGSQDSAVSEVTEQFYAALADEDGAGACALLAPSTRSELEESAAQECSKAILEEKIPKVDGSGAVEVFDTMASARFDADTAFLTRMPDGWRVLAVACTPKPSGPYDCTVNGG